LRVSQIKKKNNNNKWKRKLTQIKNKLDFLLLRMWKVLVICLQLFGFETGNKEFGAERDGLRMCGG